MFATIKVAAGPFKTLYLKFTSGDSGKLTLQVDNKLQYRQFGY